MSIQRTSPVLFSIKLDKASLNELKAGTLPEKLRQEFRDHGINLSSEATIQTLEASKRWRVTDGGRQYFVEEVEESLNIYTSLLPELYGRWTLDCVIEVARSVSLDFVSRPQHYQLVPDDIAQTLQDFKARTGNQPEWPSMRATFVKPPAAD